MNEFEQWVTQETAVFMLEATRMTGLIVTAPLAWMHLPTRVRVALVLLVTFVLHGPARAADLRDASTLYLGFALVSEFALGAALGFSTRLIFAVGEIAADSIAPVMGLSGAQMFDPSFGGQSTVLTKLLRYIAGLVFLLAGVHHMLLSALFHSFSAIPAGSLIYPGVFGPTLTNLVADTLLAGVKLGMPIVAVLFICQIGLAFVARAAPAMQIFSIGFAVTLGVGGLLWVVFAPDFIAELVYLRSTAEHSLIRLLEVAEGSLP